MEKNKIILKDITKDFRRIRALDNINLEIKSGEYIVILGESGAGKTTLLKVIAGLVKPSSGQIVIDGSNITKSTPEERQIAFLPQDYALFPRMNVWDNVAYSPRLQRRKNADEISELCKEILALVHLSERPDAYPHELSGGMKQRTALSRSLAAEFKILLLDEPLRALDARLRLELRGELRKLAQDLGLTVLHVTHDQEEAMSIADRIVVLHKGKIKQIGDQEEIYLNPLDGFVATFMGESNQWDVEVISKVEVNSEDFKRDVASQDNLTTFYTLRDQYGNEFYSLTKKEFSIGENLLLFVKAEAIKASKPKKPKKEIDKPIADDTLNNEEFRKSNRFKGVVTQKFYLGKWTNLEIQLQNVPEQAPKWTVKLASRRAVRMKIGDQIKLRAKPKFLFLFQR
ncbi:MAG: ABC transporter ATP-binding protein [Candidatus Hodarchaeales archaeon]|jgi:ABC-type Fe3+/spermidine/putrescine transport system ATPase subunit